MKETEFKNVVCLDFDGVIYSFSSGWVGDESNLPDEPVKGARWAVKELREKFNLKVIVYSARCETEKGRKAIKEWLKKYDIKVDGVAEHKPIAFVYVDDRGLNFDGNWVRMLPDIVGFISYMDYGKGKGGGILNKQKDNHSQEWI